MTFFNKFLNSYKYVHEIHVNWNLTFTLFSEWFVVTHFTLKMCLLVEKDREKRSVKSVIFLGKYTSGSNYLVKQNKILTNEFWHHNVSLCYFQKRALHIIWKHVQKFLSWLEYEKRKQQSLQWSIIFIEGNEMFHDFSNTDRDQMKTLNFHSIRRVLLEVVKHVGLSETWKPELWTLQNYESGSWSTHVVCPLTSSYQFHHWHWFHIRKYIK